MSFRPNYGKKNAGNGAPEGEERKPKSYGYRRYRRNDVTEEERLAMALLETPSMENEEGIIRYVIEDLMKLREKNTSMPEMTQEECVIGYDRLKEMLREHADLVTEKEQVMAPAVEFPTEVANSVRVDSRVRSLRNIMNQFTLDNPELISDMLTKNIEEYIEEPEVLRAAMETMMSRCSMESLYCDAFITTLTRVLGKMIEKQRQLFFTCLLKCCQAKYEEKTPDAIWAKMDESIAEEAKEVYANGRNGFFHFLGTLFVNELIHQDVVLRVLVDLSQGYPDQTESVRYVLTLVRRIGSFMEREGADKLTIDEIFRTLHLWQEENLVGEELISEIRAIRDLKDLKWVTTVEVDKNMESTITADWEKSVVGRRKNVRHETMEDAEHMRQLNELILYCRNMWLDFVHFFVVEDLMEEVEKLDEEQREVFMQCVMKAISPCSELEQRRAAVVLVQLVERRMISEESFTRVMERLLAEYVKARKSNHSMLITFRNLFFLLMQEGYLRVSSVVELWKNKEHYDGLLAELVFDLMNSWKNVDKEAAMAAMGEMKLTVEKVFVGGCPAMVVDRLLAKHGMAEKDGVIVYA